VALRATASKEASSYLAEGLKSDLWSDATRSAAFSPSEHYVDREIEQENERSECNADLSIYRETISKA